MVLMLAFLVALVSTPPAAWVARRVGLLDLPGELKVQRSAVPYLGGVGVAAGLAVGVVPTHPRLLIPLALALALGVVDDARTIGAAARLSLECVLGLVAATMLSTRVPGLLGAVAVAAVVVLMINAVNMLDGLDALAAGVALTSALGFALVLDGDARTIALALAGALAGFLVFNRPPAKVYLGDGGAYLVGTALALLLCMAWTEESAWELSVGSLVLVACPVAEFACTVLRRIRSRKGLFAGDREHGYDRLIHRGWSPNRSVLAYVATQAALSALAVGAVRLPVLAAAGVTAVCAVALLSIIAAMGFDRGCPEATA